MPKSTSPLKCYFDILGEDKQLLQLMLMPGQRFYAMSPQIIYGSEHLVARTRDEVFARLFKLNSRALVSLRSDTRHNACEYIAFRRNTGKILCLDLGLYGDMFCNIDYLTGINYEPKNAVMPQAHPHSNNLILFAPEHNEQENFVFAQSAGSPYIEKQLGEGEKIQTDISNVLAVSRKSKIAKRGAIITIQGPGFVFMSPGSAPRARRNNFFAQLIYIGLALVVVQLIFATILAF